MKDHNELLLFFIIIVFVVDIDVMKEPVLTLLEWLEIFVNAKGSKAFSMQL